MYFQDLGSYCMFSFINFIFYIPSTNVYEMSVANTCKQAQYLQSLIILSVLQKNPCLDYSVISPVPEQETGMMFTNSHVSSLNEEQDIWEIDATLLRYEKKIASGSYGDL